MYFIECLENYFIQKIWTWGCLTLCGCRLIIWLYAAMKRKQIVNFHKRAISNIMWFVQFNTENKIVAVKEW